ncbi:hypothetical protein CCL11_06305 [Pseudomonas syringae]|nr:hypothetical protein CCL11_06305 [Pseudomonas syringae]PPS46271.1 hypothetical protein B0F86_08980 [Pseudomonas syringae]RXT59732.1 hypothetical protein B1F74_27150 [Pseudomonas syringae]
MGIPFLTLRVTPSRGPLRSELHPHAEYGCTISVSPDTSRSSRSSVGMLFVMLRVKPQAQKPVSRVSDGNCAAPS